jgi:hypothetical protein
MITTYSLLAAFINSAVIKSPEYSDPANHEFKLNQPTFKLPKSLAAKINSLLLDNDKLLKIKASKPDLLNELVELRNLFRVFGTDCEPTFKNDGGTLSTMYSAQICKNVETNSIQIAFGSAARQLKYSEVNEVWESTPSQEGLENFNVITRVERIPTSNGELKLLIGECAIGGKITKASEKFITRFKLVQKEVNGKLLDVVNCEKLETMFNDADEQLLEVLAKPYSGNKFAFPFVDERFKFGKYPVVGLRTDPRPTWVNYIAVVLDETGNEIGARFDNATNKAMFNLLANYYEIDADDKTTDKTEDFDILDDLFDSKEILYHHIVYYGKIQKTKTAGVNKGEVYYQSMLKIETSNEPLKFEPLSDADVLRYQIGIYAPKPSTKTNDTLQEIVEGVDDILDPLSF